MSLPTPALTQRFWTGARGAAGNRAKSATGSSCGRWSSRRGELFLRVHWVAVPKALHARRVNRSRYLLTFDSAELERRYGTFLLRRDWGGAALRNRLLKFLAGECVRAITAASGHPNHRVQSWSNTTGAGGDSGIDHNKN
jgi:hypothetical protein